MTVDLKQILFLIYELGDRMVLLYLRTLSTLVTELMDLYCYSTTWSDFYFISA